MYTQLTAGLHTPHMYVRRAACITGSCRLSHTCAHMQGHGHSMLNMHTRSHRHMNTHRSAALTTVHTHPSYTYVHTRTLWTYSWACCSHPVFWIFPQLESARLPQTGLGDTGDTFSFTDSDPAPPPKHHAWPHKARYVGATA